MGSCSTLDLAEEDVGSFTDEYSVRIEVYETEVTDSGGSAPIIQISGLCDTDHRAPYLLGQQSLLSFTYEDEPDKCGDTPLYKDGVSRFPSLQVLRGSPAVRAPPQAVPSATQAAGPRNEALKSSWESNPFTLTFAGDASCKWPVISPNFAVHDCACRQLCCETHNSAPPPLQSCYEDSAFGGGRPRENSDYRRPRKGVHKNVTEDAYLTRSAPRSRKTTTIPSRLSRSVWDAENQQARRSNCTYRLDSYTGRTYSAAELITCCHLHCVKESVTTRHLSATERRILRLHACETSLHEGWGCTDLSTVYRILPPQKTSHGYQWAASKIGTRENVNELREVFVTASDNVMLDALSSPFPNKRCSTKNSSVRNLDGSVTRVCSVATVAHARNQCACERGTQTAPLRQSMLPSVVTSLIDRFALTCYEIVVRLSSDASDMMDQPLSENFEKCDPDVWNRVMVHVQERMASVAHPFSAGRPADGMRGDGECPVDLALKKLVRPAK